MVQRTEQVGAQVDAPSDWNDDIAIVALEETRTSHLHEQQQASRVVLPPAVPVPEPLPQGMKGTKGGI